MLSTLGSIFLPSVDRTQQGEYTCLASNGVGPIARKTTYLSVNCKCYSLLTFQSILKNVASKLDRSESFDSDCEFVINFIKDEWHIYETLKHCSHSAP